LLVNLPGFFSQSQHPRLQVTGILGILLRAKQTGELSSLQPAIEDLAQKAGFRIAPDLLAKVLQA
jgi:predicted nucleic acid-binding protein